MNRTIRLTLGVAALGLAGLASAPAALADTVCDSYSGTCVTTGPIGGGGGAVGVLGGAGTVNGSGNTLPFTGADVLVVGLLGGGAIAAGTVLLVAGKRRTAAAL